MTRRGKRKEVSRKKTRGSRGKGRSGEVGEKKIS